MVEFGIGAKFCILRGAGYFTPQPHIGIEIRENGFSTR